MQRDGMFTVCGTLLLAALVATPSTAQQTEDPQSRAPEKKAEVEVQKQVDVEVDVGDRAPRPEERAEERISQLSDFHLASWIILENDVQLRVSQLATEQARTPAVKQYAQRMVQSHNQLMDRLHKPLQEFARQDDERVEFDFAAVLEEVTQRVREVENRQRLGYRGTEEDPARTDDARRRLLDAVRERRERREEAREDVEEQREDLRDARRDREILDRDRRNDRDDDDRETRRRDRREDDERGRIRDRRDDRDREGRPVREERGELREERQDLRQQRRETRRNEQGPFDGEFRAAVRENLPEILSLVKEVVETADNDRDSGLAFIQLKQQVSEKHAQSVIEEIRRQPEGHFDQAYVGFEIANHLRMIDTMEMAQRHASPELSGTLDQSIQTMQQHLDDARQLMKEISHRDEPAGTDGE